MNRLMRGILLSMLIVLMTGTYVEAAGNKSSNNTTIKKNKTNKSKRKKKSQKPKAVKKEWHFLVGWGNGAVVAGAGYTKALSSNGFWRLETSFNTAVSDAGLGAITNNYSFNALLTMNITLFSRLRLTAKGGPAIRHRGLGIDANNEYYNYGATIALDLDKRGSYGIFYYADAIGFSYISKF